ncbi:hypothetical protein VTO42DRAFT_3511 [Malbranchea cinnamomea]
MSEILAEQIEALKERQKESNNSSPASSKEDDTKSTNQKLPKGVVLGKDGKPCRTCTSAAEWRALARMKSPTTSFSTSNPSTATSPSSAAAGAAAAAAAISASSIANDCPPDVEELGRSTWTLLHSMAATYPTQASPQQQSDMQGFLSLFSRLYPCWVCADDFRNWMNDPSGRNKPRLSGRSEFGNWLCEAHNEVNRKLGKKVFDCSKWEERWRTGWKDGRCD